MLNFCSHCGHTLPSSDSYPRKCPQCDTEHYNSPKPVVALIIHAISPDGLWSGWILIRRGIKPSIDGWALPGGYLDHAEDWRHACVREAQEELGVTINPKFLYIVDAASAPKFNTLVLVVEYSGIVNIPDLFHNDTIEKITKGEIREIQVTCDPDLILCFESHQRIWEQLTQPKVK